MEVSNPSISCFIIKNPVDQWNRTEIGIIILNFVPKNNNFDWSDFACRSFQEQNRNKIEQHSGLKYDWLILSHMI